MWKNMMAIFLSSVMIVANSSQALSETEQSKDGQVFQDGAVYKITSKYTGMSMAASTFGMSSLACVARTESYSGSLNQGWRAHLQTDGTWKLENLSTGRYLTVYRNSKKDGAVVAVSDEKESKSQCWRVEETSKGIRIVSLSSGKCLQLKDDQRGLNTNIVQNEIDKGESQFWKIEMLDDGSTVFPRMLLATGDINAISCPEIIKEEGIYYLFGDNRDGCGIRRSTDLLTWEALSNACTYKNGFTSIWQQNEVDKGELWCPGIYKIGDLYHIYYAITTLGSRRSVIGHYTNTTLDQNSPDYHWVEAGAVIRSYETNDYNCIDPCVITDQEGRVWLLFGSGWSGLKMAELNPQTGKLLHPEDDLIPIAYYSTRTDYCEAGYIKYHDGYYYLMMAIGYMKPGHYVNVVGRSRNITGPYVDRDGRAMLKNGGTKITEDKESMTMPGHCSLFEDEDGQWYHVIEYFPEGADATLGLSTIVWDEDGWPWAAMTPGVLSLGNGQ